MAGQLHSSFRLIHLEEILSEVPRTASTLDTGLKKTPYTEAQRQSCIPKLLCVLMLRITSPPWSEHNQPGLLIPDAQIFSAGVQGLGHLSLGAQDHSSPGCCFSDTSPRTQWPQKVWSVQKKGWSGLWRWSSTFTEHH